MRGLALHLLLVASAAQALDRPSDVTALMAHSKAFQRCYERSLQDHPALKGKVVLQVDIDASGKVAEAKVTQSSMHDWALERCLAAAAQRVRFPATGRPRRLSVPFTFLAAE